VSVIGESKRPANGVAVAGSIVKTMSIHELSGHAVVVLCVEPN
jgi:hypothetical protein